MILSDRSIREAIADKRIEIDPLDERDIQPSSVDLHLDRYFRVFLNHTMRTIDVKEDQEELTQLVEIREDDAFVLHPGEFVLGSTIERVKLPDDLVARLEGKSSLGRLGLLIHSSLPAGETVVVRDRDGNLEPRPIETVVRKRLDGDVVGFDPDTLETTYFPITGWYEGPPDRIFEIRLASGRRVRVTGGHNLFTLDRHGAVKKTRTLELASGTRVAIPRTIPDPSTSAPTIDLRRFVPDSALAALVVTGPTVAEAFRRDAAIVGLLRDAGVRHTDHYRRTSALPATVARQVPGLWDALGPRDGMRARGAKRSLPVVIDLDGELAWLLGLYVAEGYRRRGQVVWSNTKGANLDRAEAALGRLGQTVYRADGTAIACSSNLLAELLGWIGTGGKASTKRIPPAVFGWPQLLLRAFFDGMLDGDGSRGDDRDSYWTSSPGLAADVMLLAARLGRHAGACFRGRPGTQGLYQLMLPHREHELLTSVPLPDRLLVAIRDELGLAQNEAAAQAGFGHSTDLSNIENRTGGDAVRRATLRRLRDVYRSAGAAAAMPLLDRLVDGGVAWDEVVDVVDTGACETVFDLEVRPDGRHVENFVAGAGGVFVSNTAGFVDAGWDGQLTLELSNVANLPITLYPGMKIGQISFLQMTTAADNPYGSTAVGSKYQHQVGPRPSRYFENFDRG